MLMQTTDSDQGVAAAGRSMRDMLKGKGGAETRNEQSNGSPRPLIRRTADPTRPGQTQSGSRPPSLLIRRTSQPERPGNQQASPQPGQLLRRADSQSSGASRPAPLLRRTGGPATGSGQVLRRTAPPGGQRSGARSGPGQQKKSDPRRRKAVQRPDGEGGNRRAGLEEAMEDNITSYIDRPDNPTEPITYNPYQMNLEELRADWPNTPLTGAGLTESIVQKLRWLAKRLPHGYRSPQQLAQDLLGHKFVHFESEAEKQEVLKVAKELSAEFHQAVTEGTKKHSDMYNFHTASQKKSNFSSIKDHEGDNKLLVGGSVQGIYAQPPEQPYPFMQNAARMLFNNGSYRPESSERLLARVQALIPQRGAAAQQAQKAS